MWYRKNKKNKIIAHHYLPEAKKKYYNKLILFIFIFIISSLIGLLIYQNKYLTIKQIIINRDNNQFELISEQEIRKSIQELMSNRFLLFFRHNTLLTLRKGEAEKKLLSDSRIQSIKIIKKWPDKLIINFSEEQPSVRLSIFGDKDYFLNSSGQLISPIFDILRHLDKPIIIDKTTKKWQDQSLSETIKIVLNLFQHQTELQNFIEFKTAEITEDKGILELKIMTNEGWASYFVPEENIDQQIANLKFILENQLPLDRRKGLEYIDLRFGNRIYYK